MKIISHSILSGVLLLLITSSCEDMLTKEPTDSPSNINFYSNEAELLAAINGAYRVLWLEYHFETGETPLGNELDNSTDIGFLRTGQAKVIAQGGHSSTNPLIGSVWNKLYADIGKVNSLLDNMSRADNEVSHEFAKRIKGEAKFLRAFAYHYLVELYGDVPLITSVPSLEEAHLGRTPKLEVVGQIIEDLNFSAEILPESWSGDDEGRVTKGAVLALKARVALYNEMFDLAASTSQEIINSGVYSLYPDYEGLFKYEGQRSSEVILDAAYERGIHSQNLPFRMATRLANGVSTNVPSQFMIDSYIASDGKSIDESSVYDPRRPFENRDPRLDASIVRPQSEFLNYIFETHPDSSQTYRIDGDDRERVTNLDVTNPYATFTGLIWRKYNSEEDLPGNRSDSSLNWIHIRYAEVLLIYAEAKIELDEIDQSVLNALNEIRARSFGVDPSFTDQYPSIQTTNQEELRRILRNERKVELALEGFRLFDIRRWGIAENVMNGNLIGRPLSDYSEVTSPPEIDQATGHPDYGHLQDLYRNVESRSFDPNRDYLWPIPQEEMDANEKITQNPGY